MKKKPARTLPLRKSAAFLRSRITQLEATVQEYEKQTAAWQTERATREREQYFLETVLEAFPVGLAVLDAMSRFVKKNTSYKMIWGEQGLATKEIARQQSFSSWVETQTRVDVEEWGFRKALVQGTVTIGQRIEITTFDGQQKMLSHSAAPLYDETNTIVGVVVAAVDMTLQQQREAALQHDKEAAEAANRTKSEFLATISHELRSPLGVILGYTQLLSEHTFGVLTEDQTYILHKIDRYARDIFDLITTVLDLSRLDAGQLPLAMVKVQLPEFFEDLQNEMQHLQEESSLNFLWQLEENLCPLRTDPGKLKLILKNLIGNAVKFTPAGAITITARNEADGIMLSVADTGIGIPSEARELIFEPFYQVKNLPSQQQSGVGLGLHIVKRLVNVLGGTVTVETEVGLGSTFQVWLPCRSDIR